jgi:hypothetical protein
MAILSRPSFGPRTALIYVTIGALLNVWVAVWFFTVVRPEGGPQSHYTWFWLLGLFLTGLTLIILGTMLGHIGQAARRAELPPSEAIPAEARTQVAAAANPHPPVPMSVPVTVPGQVYPGEFHS